MQDIDLTQADEVDRPPHIADIQRLIVTVKNKDILTHTLSNKKARRDTRAGRAYLPVLE